MSKLAWLENPNIRPYVFARKENRPARPGSAYPFPLLNNRRSDWLILEPTNMGEVHFGNQIMLLDQAAFNANGLVTPRWVIYDCAVMPGLIAGYAAKTSTLSAHVKEKLKVNEMLEWTPISLFIVIPTPEEGRWMAHNLGSMNSFVNESDRLWGLGFLSKAFGLWYTNIRELYGVAQWTSPSLKLHANYGPLEVITAYTPIHDYPNSISYRLWVDTHYWNHFLNRSPMPNDNLDYAPSGFEINPKSEESMIDIQSKLETQQGPFYLLGSELLTKPLGASLNLYRRV